MAYNKAMKDFKPYLTNDGTIGLYNEEFDDIYHSATGALTEAYEKFIYPIDFANLLKKDKINVLDICYGIGYNSKSFLNYIFENFSKKNLNKNSSIETIYTNNNKTNNYSYIEKIHSNNISEKSKNHYAYTDMIYPNNIFSKISVTAIDNDKILSFLSPFIKTDIKNFYNKNLEFKYEKIEKYINAGKKNKSKLKINKLINFLIYQKIAQNYPEIYQNTDIISILGKKEYSPIFDKDIMGVFKRDKYKTGNKSLKKSKLPFLHNIYYQHVSNEYKKRLKAYNLQDINFNLQIDDARQIIKKDNNLYNLIFLDAFTPTKCPCLWSLEFFTQLYNHLEDDGMILTYVRSASVRNAMINAGFYIGEIYNERENKFTGTVATKNNELIKYKLTEYDLGLLKTTAGIFYRDENLTDLNETIIERRNIEVKNSNIMSSSKYNKLHNKK